MSSRVFLHPEITDNHRHAKKCTTHFSKKLYIPEYRQTVVLRLTDTSIMADYDTLIPVSPGYMITMTEGLVV